MDVKLDCEEGWGPKNWCVWTMVVEKTLESPLDCKEIQPVHSEGDQPWDFFGRNDAKAETLILWPPHAKSWLIGKDSDAERDWGQEEKGTTEDEMAGWHHWLDGHDFEWTPGVGDGQGGLACCDSWGCKESDTIERLIWSDLIWLKQSLSFTVVILKSSPCKFHESASADNVFVQSIHEKPSLLSEFPFVSLLRKRSAFKKLLLWWGSKKSQACFYYCLSSRKLSAWE